MEGHKKSSPTPSRFTVGYNRSFANVVRAHLGCSHNSQLVGWNPWKCRACGSWDVFATMIRQKQDGIYNKLKQKVSFKDSIIDVSLSPGKKRGSKDCLGVSSPCVNQFKVLRDLLENCPSCDCKCSSPCSSPFASRIPKSPLVDRSLGRLSLPLMLGQALSNCRSWEGRLSRKKDCIKIMLKVLMVFLALFYWLRESR